MTETEKALDALMRERNTWARQMTDLRDELDTARAETERAHAMRPETAGERDHLALRLSDAHEALDAAQKAH